MPLFFLGFLFTDFLVHSALLFIPSAVGNGAKRVIPLDVKLGNAGLIKEDGPFCHFDNIGGGQ